MAEHKANGKKPPTEAVASIASQLPVDQLKAELVDFLKALGRLAASSATNQLGQLPAKLPGVAKAAAQRLPGIGSLIGGADGSVAKKVVDAGAKGVKDAAKGAVGGGGGGSQGGKVTNIVETVDVGVPVSVAYNQWTRFTDFPGFMKKVEKVEQESETENQWRAQIFMSHRDWKTTILEQVPDERIVWRSEAAKGRADGAISFHALTPDLTRIMMVLQYYPQGFFEKVGNLWRAQGRRARLELKHFQRHVMTEVALHPEEVEGWRGEIHDGEVASSPEQEPDEQEPDEQEPDEQEPDEQEPDEQEPDEAEPAEREPRRRAAQRQPARSGAGRRSREGKR